MYLTAETVAALRLPERQIVRGRRGQVKRVRLLPDGDLTRPVLTRAGSVERTQLGDGHYCYSMIGRAGRAI